jgi:hypothetical protein
MRQVKPVCRVARFRRGVRILGTSGRQGGFVPNRNPLNAGLMPARHAAGAVWSRDCLSGV